MSNRIWQRIKAEHGIALLMVGVFFLSVIGSTYALPMRVIGDEESIIGGALKMLETRHFIPAMYPQDFAFLYYPVVLPYLILIASIPAILVHAAMVSFSLTALQDVIITNLTPVWISARLISAIAATLMVACTYGTVRLLMNRRAAWWAAVLLGTSFLHVNMSHWMKHWMLVTLCAYGAFYCIIRYQKNNDIPAWWTSVVAAIGVGVSYVAGFAHIISGIYVLIHRRQFGQRFNRFVSSNVVIFCILTLVIIAAHYQDLLDQFVRDNGTVTNPKSWLGLWETIRYGLGVLWRQETILVITSVGALIFGRRHRMLSAVGYGIVLLYLAAVYAFYHIEVRYLYIVLPLLAWSGGAFVARVMERIPSWSIRALFGCLVLAYPLSVVLRYDYLLVVPDTRELATQWIRENGRETDLLVDSRSLELPRTRESLQREQMYGRLRSSERYTLQNYDRVAQNDEQRFNYANIHFWENGTGSGDLARYITEYRPKYLVIERWQPSLASADMQLLLSDAKLVVEFRQSSLPQDYDINGNFYTFNTIVYKLQRLGPTMRIYELSAL